MTAIYKPPQLAVGVQTLGDLLRSRAAHQPSRLAYTFLVDGEEREVNLTYQELNEKARTLAAHLQSQGLGGERILLSYPPGPEFIVAFFGCLYVGAVAVPAYPPRRNHGLSRLHNIIEDAQVRGVLTTSGVISRVKPILSEFPEFGTLRWLATDDLRDDYGRHLREPEVSGKTLALLQYTSGSTSRPRGVMLTHANLLYNSHFVHQACEHTVDDKYVSWLPTFHDMGLMAGVLQPLFGGFPAILMSPASFLQRPLRWLDTISRYGATTSGGPNFAYDLCVRKIEMEDRVNLDLSSWSVAFNGAEPIRHETLERFSRAFEHCGFRHESFYPCYGLAEATLMVSGSFRSAQPTIKSVCRRGLERRLVINVTDEADGSRKLVGCGRARLDQKILIVHPDSLTECSPHEIGEIWIAGESVAKGYWGHHRETAHTFQARLAATGEGPFLRTGDLGFIENGELFVTGRIKDLIIIRGLNHYPQDIERTVERCHVALREGGGAAFSIEVMGEERLIIVQEVKSRRCPIAREVIEEIRRAVAEEHEIEVHSIALISPGSIPKTSSGKVQRRLCREKFRENSLLILESWQEAPEVGNYLLRTALVAPPENAQLVEGWLGEYIAVSRGISLSEVDTGRPLTHYGIDSLRAVELTHRIEAAFGIVVSPGGLFDSSSLVELARDIQERSKMNARAHMPGSLYAADSSVGRRLSYGQQGLWFLAKLAPVSSAYNIAMAACLNIDADIDSLRQAFQLLLNRHASLRTVFVVSRDGEPTQRILESASVYFRVEEASDLEEAELRKRITLESEHPFDLEHGPLLRIILFNRLALRPVLLLVAHHIIADFWSLEIMVYELGIFYEAVRSGKQSDLQAPTLEYHRYAQWQRERMEGDEGEGHWSYWRKQLSGELPILNLPTDRPRPPEQSFRGASGKMILSAELTQRFKAIAQSQGATLYMSLLAAFQALLYRYSGQEDILVGAPAAGRSLASTKGVVGYFVNPLAIRVNASADLTYKAFLRQTRRTVLDAFDHQDYPFALLVDRLRPVRNSNLPPLIQALFIWQQAHLLGLEGMAAFALCHEGEKVDLGPLQLESIMVEKHTAQFDLSLMMGELSGRLVGSIEYASDLFESITIRRMEQHFRILLAEIVAAPERLLSEYSFLSPEERHQAVVEWNETESECRRVQHIHELFEEQAERAPDKIAVVFSDEQLTYEELNRRANRLARYLRHYGIGAESLVGVMLPRTIDSLVGLLGTLKAGGAYLPLDAAYPVERLSFMLDDTQVSVLLTETSMAEAGRWDPRIRLIRLDAEWPLIARENPDNLITEAGNSAYIIYTSGSTGQPKGVVIEHRSAVNFLSWAIETFTSEELEGVMASTSICFDLSVFELFTPLSCGGRVIITENALNVSGQLATQEATLINTVPSVMAELLREGSLPASLRTINLAGEPLPKTLVQGLHRLPGIERVFNLYGPTEATTYSTSICMPNQIQAEPSIGRPVANTQVYISDCALQLAPVGAPGEVCIGGKGLARGYWERPDLTGERFIPNPWDSEPGERLYRTGDLARYLSNGEIEFLGRSDSQVKVRGYRIELGEVEAVLRRLPEVSEAVVLIREDHRAEKSLVAYVVPRVEADLSVGAVRESLSEKLPDFMMPTFLVSLDSMPLMPNGKIDRRALLTLTPPGYHRQETFVAPRNRVEERLARVWSELLNLERVGVHDNFFELGGNSLLATQVVSRLRDAFKVEMKVGGFLAVPTIAQLSAAILRHKASAIDPHELKRLAEEALRASIPELRFNKRAPLDTQVAEGGDNHE